MDASTTAGLLSDGDGDVLVLSIGVRKPKRDLDSTKVEALADEAPNTVKRVREIVILPGREDRVMAFKVKGNAGSF